MGQDHTVYHTQLHTMLQQLLKGLAQGCSQAKAIQRIQDNGFPHSAAAGGTAFTVVAACFYHIVLII